MPADPQAYYALRRGRVGLVTPKPSKATPHLHPAEQRAQASLMMMQRLCNNTTTSQIGDEFGVTPRTVTRRLALARADGVPDAARQIFIDEMLPESMVVLQEALRGDDAKLAVQVALKVVDGLKAMELPAAASAVADESLEIWRERIKLTRSTAVPSSPAGDGASPAGETVEGVCIRCPSGDNPPTPSPDSAGTGSALVEGATS